MYKFQWEFRKANWRVKVRDSEINQQERNVKENVYKSPRAKRWTVPEALINDRWRVKSKNKTCRWFLS